jgi:hypothetical protein
VASGVDGNGEAERFRGLEIDHQAEERPSDGRAAEKRYDLATASIKKICS